MSPLYLIRRRLLDYRLQLGFRAVVIAAAVGFAVVLGFTGGAAAWIGVIALGLFALIRVFALVRFAERPLREIVRFVEGIRYDDFTVHIGKRNSGPLLGALAEGFTEVGDTLRRLRSEREEQARFLDLVIRHVPVALLAYDEAGNVTIFNPAARRLLDVPRLRMMEQLRGVSPVLEQTLRRVSSGEQALVRLDRKGRKLDLAVHATRFRLGTESTTLVSLQDIRQELEEKELEAWQQLTRVLTHEIVNSVAPIASLAAIARERAAAVEAGGGSASSAEAFSAVREAIETIERRSDGLVRFVDAYRSMSRLPQPRIESVPVSDLFAGTQLLLGAKLREKGVGLETSIRPPNLEVNVDPELVEQVLINLVLNAIEALDGRPDPRVQLESLLDGMGRPMLRVIDNGPGIDPDVQERIFVPFFTTKRTGSGIGLSLARQIARLHGGSLTVQSDPGKETVFTIRL
jgi:two-component system, NtrC family, nitrogen regulation sensor histidine kinase NtrY